MANKDLRRINIPIPNPALGAWLKGPQCRAFVEEVTQEIYRNYYNALPVITGDLKRGAYARVGLGSWGAGEDRWFGWVGNRVQSGPPDHPGPGPSYSRSIEYGQSARGIPGQHQLRRAAHFVAEGLGDASGFQIPGIARDRRGRGSTLRSRASGQFVRNPLNRD